MQSEIFTYGALANYHPRGNSEYAKQSQEICGRVKAGDAKVIVSTFNCLSAQAAGFVKDFLDNETTLVPVPRSSPLSSAATLWPAKVIADLLIEQGYGKEVYPCLVRTQAIRKSSLYYDSESRPSVTEHHNSIGVSPDLRPAPVKITLVDDVITLGRTTSACAQLLKKAFPEAQIRILTIVRTQQKELDELHGPFTGKITCYASGKTWRDDGTPPTSNLLF